MDRPRPTAPIAPVDYKGLGEITWNRDPARPIPAGEVFALYERNWHLLDAGTLSRRERQLIEDLTAEFGRGILLV